MLSTKEGKIIIAVWILLVLGLVLLPHRASLTGFVVYGGELKSHSFAFDTFIFDRTAINISANELKLNLITETRSYDTREIEIINVSSARKDGEDKTNKVKNIDGNAVNIKKDSDMIFDVIFNNDLNNSDIMQFYLLASDVSEIYLCNLSQNCESPGYGKVDYNGGEGFYNITLSGMEDEKQSFNIDPAPTVKFDYIRALKEYNLTHYYDITYYPMQAIAETDDFVPDSLFGWEGVAAEEILNGQVVEYYYSTDSGLAWHYIENKDLSDADASSGKIRIRILLMSNGISTPVIKNLSLNYQEAVTCDPEWQPDSSQCQPDDSKIITYTDLNNCNTTENLPQDNGTAVHCDYCAPEWQETNTSCLIDNTINQYFTDLKNCYETTGLESDNSAPGNNTYGCDYCIPSISEFNTTCSGQADFETYYTDSNDCYSTTGLVSDIVPKNITNACIYNQTPQNTTNLTEEQGQNNSTEEEETQQPAPAQETGRRRPRPESSPETQEGIITPAAEEIAPQEEKVAELAAETDEKSAETEAEKSAETSLSPAYDYGFEDAENSTALRQIGKLISNGSKKKSDFALAGILVAMIAAIYVIVEIKVRKNHIKHE